MILALVALDIDLLHGWLVKDVLVHPHCEQALVVMGLGALEIAAVTTNIKLARSIHAIDKYCLTSSWERIRTPCIGLPKPVV